MKHFKWFAALLTFAVVAFTGNLADPMSQFSIAVAVAWAVRDFLPAINLQLSNGLNVAAADAISEQLQQLSTSLADAVKRSDGTMLELKTRSDDFKNRLEKGETVTKEVKDALDVVLGKANEQALAVKTVEEKLRDLAQAVDEAKKNPQQPLVKTAGELLIESDSYKQFKEANHAGHARVIVPREKQITTVSAGGLMRQPYQDSLVSLERIALRIRDLLTIIPVDAPSVEYARQTTRTNNAAPVAEGAAKPYSDYAWDVATANIRTLAHLAKLTRQAVDDAPRLAAEVESELRYGLALLEENQLLNGSGTGQNILGIMPQATAFNQAANLAKVTDPTMIDVLRLALLQNVLAGAPADGMVLNPADWALIELTKTTDGAYLMANPQGGIAQQLWRVPVVDSVSMTADNFLVGAFKYGANLYDRMNVEVRLSSENDKDFEQNLLTMRCEERIGLGVRRPYAFTKGVFSTILVTP